MSNNKDGKQGANGNGKGKGKGDKGIPVARVVKVQQPKGPVPDFKHVKVKAEVVQTDLNIVWNGWTSLVKHKDVLLRVAKERSSNGEREFPAVHVVSAPAGSPLEGLGGGKTYLTVATARMKSFSSKADPKSKSYDTQKRIYEFLDDGFREAGLKQAQVASNVVAFPASGDKVCHSMADQPKAA